MSGNKAITHPHQEFLLYWPHPFALAASGGNPGGLRGPRGLLVLTLCVLLCGFAWGSVAQKVEEGNRLFKEGRYEEALNRYGEAHSQHPDSPEVLFNMGDGFYRQRKYNEAIEAHVQSLSRQGEGLPSLQAKAHYNIGDSLFRQDKLEEALEAYKRAIDLEPGDVDTKYNIEFIQRQLKEKQKPQKKEALSQNQTQPEPQKQQEKGGGQQGKDKEESEGGSKQEKERPEESEREKQASEKQEEKEESSPQVPSASPQGISKEDAERLLGALRAEEKNLPAVLKEGEKKFVEAPPEKDW